MLTETSDTWINVSAGFRGGGNGLRPLPDGGFLWTSERSGWRHIHRYEAAGELLGPVRSGS